MAKKCSKAQRAKVNRSNGQHLRLWRKALKKNDIREARYHGEIRKRQVRRCTILSRKEKRSIFKKAKA